MPMVPDDRYQPARDKLTGKTYWVWQINDREQKVTTLGAPQPMKQVDDAPAGEFFIDAERI